MIVVALSPINDKEDYPMKRIISIIFMLLCMLLVIILDSGFQGITTFWNAPSLIIILVITIPMLIFSDNFSDVFRGFQIAMTNREYTSKELECSHYAIGLTIRLIFLSAFFGFLVGGIGILGNISDPSRIGPSMAVCFLTIYYAAIINIFLYGIQAKVRKELIYRK